MSWNNETETIISCEPWPFRSQQYRNIHNVQCTMYILLHSQSEKQRKSNKKWRAYIMNVHAQLIMTWISKYIVHQLVGIISIFQSANVNHAHFNTGIMLDNFHYEHSYTVFGTIQIQLTVWYATFIGKLNCWKSEPKPLSKALYPRSQNRHTQTAYEFVE